MSKIKVLCIGKSDKKTKVFISEYLNRIKHYIKIDWIEEKIKNSDKNIEKHLKKNYYLVLLDEQGKMLSSKEFAFFIEKKLFFKSKDILFVIGGAYGYNKELLSKADFILSLSKMTFTHQMVRLFFIEQLYRAFTIIKAEKYHH